MALFSPWGNQQFLDQNGAPAVGWKLYTYAAGSSSPMATYTTSAGTVQHPNPIIIDALGYSTAGPVWLATGTLYKFVLMDANNVVRRTEDGISGIADPSSSSGQWQPSGVTPTYISATSFSLPGDQTNAFHIGRRLQFATNAGTVYGTISNSVFSTLTTVTVVMDAGQILDIGLNAVNLSILRADVNASPGNRMMEVRGMRGAPNSATPLVIYDFSADAVTMRNSAGFGITRFNTGTLSVNLTVAGPAPNATDQAAVIPANSFVHLYFISNGSTVQSIASLQPPTVGPALPSGYAYWAYATTVRWNASSQIIPSLTRGSTVSYDLSSGAGNRIVTGGSSLVMTSLGAGDYIPTLALMANFNGFLSLTSTPGGSFSLVVRPLGSGTGGIAVVSAYSPPNGVAVSSAPFSLPNSANTQIQYQLSAGPTTGGASIDILGYTIPNGDS
jgi:hypothetical protein